MDNLSRVLGEFIRYITESRRRAINFLLSCWGGFILLLIWGYLEGSSLLTEAWWLLVVLIAITLALILLMIRPRQRSERDKVEYPSLLTPKNDPEMVAAIQKAQESLLLFIKVFTVHHHNPKIFFSIKGKFKISEEGDEHMWLSKLKLNGYRFTGRLNTEPDWVKSLHMGDRVTVAMEDISDWIIIEQGRLYGGFTMRELIRRLSSQEQERFKKYTEAFEEIGNRTSLFDQ